LAGFGFPLGVLGGFGVPPPTGFERDNAQQNDIPVRVELVG
jgi:hypothetical protein